MTEPTARTPTGRTAPTATEPTAPPDSGFPALARLIGPGEVAGFLRQRLGAARFQTQAPVEAVRRLFDWGQLNAALAAHRLTPPRLRLERAGQDVTAGVFKSRRTRRGALLQDLDPAALTARLRDGATLILDSANELSPPLQQLCAGLAAEFSCACQANLYACWGSTQGFDVHWDDHDVFVVQVEGEKLWKLYGSTRTAPTRRDYHGEHPKPDEPLEELVLRPGDVLYLPRGYWHAAVGLGGPTLHLTVGLTRKTGADFLHWLADHMLAEAEVRRDLPLERDDTALGERLAAVLGRLSQASPAELARVYRRHVEANQAHRPTLTFPDIGGGAAAQDPAAEIRLADGVARLTPTPASNAVVLSWRGVEFTVAEALEAPLRRLLAGQTIRVADLQHAVAAAQRPEVGAFVTEMARRGVFLVGAAP